MVAEKGLLADRDQIPAHSPAFILRQHKGREQAGGVNKAGHLAFDFGHLDAGGAAYRFGDGVRRHPQLGKLLQRQDVFGDSGAHAKDSGNILDLGKADPMVR